MLELKRASKTNDEKDLICTQTAEHQTDCIIFYTTTDIKTLMSLALGNTASEHASKSSMPSARKWSVNEDLSLAPKANQANRKDS